MQQQKSYENHYACNVQHNTSNLIDICMLVNLSTNLELFVFQLLLPLCIPNTDGKPLW